MAGVVSVIWGGREQEYFCGWGWTGQITLKLLWKIDFLRRSAICLTGGLEGPGGGRLRLLDERQRGPR